MFAFPESACQCLLQLCRLPADSVARSVFSVTEVSARAQPEARETRWRTVHSCYSFWGWPCRTYRQEHVSPPTHPTGHRRTDAANINSPHCTSQPSRQGAAALHQAAPGEHPTAGPQQTGGHTAAAGSQQSPATATAETCGPQPHTPQGPEPAGPQDPVPRHKPRGQSPTRQPSQPEADLQQHSLVPTPGSHHSSGGTATASGRSQPPLPNRGAASPAHSNDWTSTAANTSVPSAPLPGTPGDKQWNSGTGGSTRGHTRPAGSSSGATGPGGTRCNSNMAAGATNTPLAARSSCRATYLPFRPATRCSTGPAHWNCFPVPPTAPAGDSSNILGNTIGSANNPGDASPHRRDATGTESQASMGTLRASVRPSYRPVAPRR